jgi:hypothetical protein
MATKLPPFDRSREGRLGVARLHRLVRVAPCPASVSGLSSRRNGRATPRDVLPSLHAFEDRRVTPLAPGDAKPGHSGGPRRFHALQGSSYAQQSHLSGGAPFGRVRVESGVRKRMAETVPLRTASQTIQLPAPNSRGVSANTSPLGSTRHERREYLLHRETTDSTDWPTRTDEAKANSCSRACRSHQTRAIAMPKAIAAMVRRSLRRISLPRQRTNGTAGLLAATSEIVRPENAL